MEVAGWWLAGLLMCLCVHLQSGQDANCDYFQQVQANQTYYVYSPNYPRNYSAGITCRWRAACPQGYNCRLRCPEVSLPASTGCNADRLLVSRSGDPTLSGADKYCGAGALDVVSTGDQLAIGLIAPSSSPGGRFLCTLGAQFAQGNASACDCGWKKDTRIVGGQETGVNEFPMMAGLVFADQSSIKCGAVIVANYYVLTAAHCVVGQNTSNLGVLVGEHNVRTADSPATQLLNVEYFTVHPRFNSSNYDNDLAVVRTRQQIQFSERVGPACLPFRYSGSSFAGAVVTALGWGTESFGGPTSDYLQEVTLNVLEQTTCRRSIGNSLTQRQLCTYSDGKDACQDDSGGPLLWQDSSTGRLHHVGVISSGQACATNLPGINTRVTEFLDWVVANTPGTTYCVK